MIMVLRNQHVLKPGDSGPAVTEIQQFLQQQPADGVFTPALRSAVATFQQQKRLSAAGREGLVGSTTLRCMLGAWPGCEVTSAGQANSNPPQGAAGNSPATGQNTPAQVSARALIVDARNHAYLNRCK